MSLLIFDFDGVIADTFADMLLFAQEACNELGISHKVTPGDLVDLDVMSFATFGVACGVPVERSEKFVRICTAKFAAKKTPPDIISGLSDVIKDLANENTLVIVTGNTSDNVRTFLTYHKLHDRFDAVFGVELPGSKTEKIIAANNRFGITEGSTWYVGDALSDIRAAREAGVSIIAVAWGHQRLDILTRGQPDMLIHKPKDLLKALKGNG